MSVRTAVEASLARKGIWPRGWGNSRVAPELHLGALGSFIVSPIIPRCPSARSAPAIILCTTTPSCDLPSLFLTIANGKCRPPIKLCRSWRPGTRDPSPTSLFLPFWMTARTFLFQAARMGTQCCANGPAIGSARSSDTKARSGARNSVTMGRVQRPAVQTSQRASPYHVVPTYSLTHAQALRFLQ